MAQLIAIVNLKGGCGKSTIAVNLACELSSKNNSVVLVDADAQATATFWSAQHRLPVRIETMPLDSSRDAQRWVSRVLGISADYLVLDAPPHVGAATEAAVGIADLVVVPVTASGADLAATVSAVDLIRRARAARADNGRPRCLLVPSKIDRRTAAGREIEAALKQFNEPIAAPVHQFVAFVDALGAGQWVGEYAPGTPAHDDITSLAIAVRRAVKK